MPSWRKIGRIFVQNHVSDLMNSHTSLPVPVRLEADIYRIFFSTRDREQRSSVCWVDIVIGEQPKVLRSAGVPVLVPGGDGAFDDSGIGVGSILVDEAGVHRLYYMGWNIGVRAPWRNSIGLATGNARIPEFGRFSAGPLLDRSPVDPFSLSYPWVLRGDDGLWRMWYGSNLSWGRDKDDMHHAIKHAWSGDGVNWTRDGKSVLAPQWPREVALARPCVVNAGGRYEMWFAYRKATYQIGYARSHDGINWEREDTLNLGPSAEGWDSEMVCYPCVFKHLNKRWMLYNGNGYGASGFGLAVEEWP